MVSLFSVSRISWSTTNSRNNVQTCSASDQPMQKHSSTTCKMACMFVPLHNGNPATGWIISSHLIYQSVLLAKIKQLQSRPQHFQYSPSDISHNSN
ncbi:hypothetical protein V6N12_071086 [Hibiscus sabdariffa]|uniref:Uncharacterized protein n=1 Tax=Hibiscus sabdariffa TaxID=183260 RepID=A0ABR2FIZ8_9ROSI